MVALDFPDTPTNGQVFDKWTWNGTAWTLTAGDGDEVVGKLIGMNNGAWRDLIPPVKMEIETGSVSYVTAANGFGSFAFKRTFSIPPLVVCMNGDSAGGLYIYNSRSITTTTYGFVVVRYDANYPPVGLTLWVNYIAIAPSA